MLGNIEFMDEEVERKIYKQCIDWMREKYNINMSKVRLQAYIAN